MTPHSPGTGQINTLIWIGFFAALIVFVAINLGLFGTLRRFRSKRGHVAHPVKPARGAQIRVAGLLSGFAILLFVLGVIFTANATSHPKTTSDGLTSYKGEKFEGPLVIKATGQQWLWRYNYPNGSFSYYKLVIPVDTEIEMKLSSTDVVHTWSVPDLAPKTDAVPGKTQDVYFRADSEGEFLGQSATLSGQAYAPMRTAVEVVSPERFEQFIVEQNKDIKAAEQSAVKIDEENAPEPEESASEASPEEPGTEGEQLVGPNAEQGSEGETSAEGEGGGG